MSTDNTEKKGQVAQKVKPDASIDQVIKGIIDDEFERIKKVEDFQDLYHAIHDIIQELNKRHGAIQFKLPKREDLKKEYEEHIRGGKMNKEDFRKLIKAVVKFENVSIGKAALDTIFFIFGAPIGSLFLKKFLPGGGSISDDIFLPAVTSLTVLVLAKTNRL